MRATGREPADDDSREEHVAAAGARLRVRVRMTDVRTGCEVRALAHHRPVATSVQTRVEVVLDDAVGCLRIWNAVKEEPFAGEFVFRPGKTANSRAYFMEFSYFWGDVSIVDVPAEVLV